MELWRTAMRDGKLALDLQNDPHVQDLLDRARDEDAALCQLLEIYRRYLGFIAREEIGPQLAAKVAPSDVVQEVIVNAYKQFASFKTDTIAGFTAWMRTLLNNRLSDARSRFTETQMRQLNREVSIQDLDSRNFLEHLATDAAQNPAELLSKLDDKLRIEAAIDKLPPHYQQIVRWRLEGLDNDEIGDRLRISSHRVRALWQRALNKLRQHLSPDLDQSETP